MNIISLIITDIHERISRDPKIMLRRHLKNVHRKNRKFTEFDNELELESWSLRKNPAPTSEMEKLQKARIEEIILLRCNNQMARTAYLDEMDKVTRRLAAL